MPPGRGLTHIKLRSAPISSMRRIAAQVPFAATTLGWRRGEEVRSSSWPGLGPCVALPSRLRTYADPLALRLGCLARQVVCFIDLYCMISFSDEPLIMIEATGIV